MDRGRVELPAACTPSRNHTKLDYLSKSKKVLVLSTFFLQILMFKLGELHESLVKEQE
jgi:hypothetical protein